MLSDMLFKKWLQLVYSLFSTHWITKIRDKGYFILAYFGKKVLFPCHGMESVVVKVTVAIIEEARDTWPHCLHNQQAETNECWCSPCSLLYIQPGS